jgi:hypothetical protein
MSEAALPVAGRRTREGVAWRRRSRRVQGLRRLLPALVGLIFLVLAVFLIFKAVVVRRHCLAFE